MFNRPLYYLLDAQGSPYPTENTHAAVFLVIDHSHAWEAEEYKPVLYETMLFIDGDEVGNATRRYHTRDESIQGHEEVVSGVEQVLMQLGQSNLDTTQIIGLLQGGDTYES